MGHSNLPPGVTDADPHFHEDPDQPCQCGHEREFHELIRGHEPCIYGEGCDCADYQPEEDDRA